MDVSIIIVNYNTISLLVDAVDSVLEKTKEIEYEIIVVDNASSDNSMNIIAGKYGNKVIYLALPENIGFGRANNEAAKIAKGRNLFFLNPDTILLNNAVKILSDYLDNNPQVGCCGGNLVDINNQPTLSYRRIIIPSIFDVINEFLSKFPEKIIYGKNIFYNYSDKPIKVSYITGADLMMQKNIFDKLGGFDPDFFMYCEESELEYRVSKASYKIYNIPYAQIKHLEGKSFSDNINKLERIMASRKIILMKMYHPILIWIINKLFLFLVISRVIIFRIIKKDDKVIFFSEIYKLMK